MPEDRERRPSQDLWLFGYGSLIWKPPPHYDLRVLGYVEGYVRRFWQASEDHRGTPASPGRVVTLIERSYWEQLGEQLSSSEPDKVYGAAYRIPASHVDDVKKYLDIREINGYSIQYTTFYPSDSPSATGTLQLPSDKISQPVENCLVYIGLPDNPQFLGLQDPDAVAKVIANSTGPSGRNDEYLFMLEMALQSSGTAGDLADFHVSNLAARVRQLTEMGRARCDDREHIRADEAADREIDRGVSGEGGEPGEETEKVVVAAGVGD